MEEKKRLQVPHTFVILAIIILLGFVMTYLLPSGVYDTVVGETGVEMADPGSYHTVEKTFLNPAALFTAVPEGLASVASIVFFIFIVCGAFQVVNATGATVVGVSSLAKLMRGKERIGIPVFMGVFALAGASFGMSEETIIFAPIGIMLARALGYDAMTGCAMVVLGANAGFVAGCMNPFTVGVAQSVAELPTFSGLGMRAIFLVIFLISVSLYVTRYARKVGEDPEKSLVRDLEIRERDQVIDLENVPALSGRQRLILLILVAAIGVMIYGIIVRGWYLTEMGAIFLAMGILCGFVGRIGVNRICEEFVEGAKTATYGALLIGLARAVIVILEDGQVIDTVVHGLANVITLLPEQVTVVGMFIVQTIINFFINSGSGQAMITMPIMVPLADIMDITRQTAVTAFQFGDGLSNALFPTSAVLMAVLSVCRIPYEKYFRFALPIILINSGIAMVLLVICGAVGFGPF